jgi:two-component system C4-dicarboxylate transport sensor histidine kinase DctB
VLEKVERIGTQASSASGMMRDLVAFARRDEAGVRTLDLARVVERALTMRRYHLARARIAVLFEPPSAGRYVTRADGHALQQVLLNVLMNAEHGLAGRQGAEIRIGMRDDEDWIEIEIVDNGPGVPTPLRERVGEPFFTTKERAAGLGLTVAPMLVAGDGGRFLLEHLAEGGTRIVTRLPKLRPPD